MKKSALTLIIFLLTVMTISATDSPFAKPDFAFPKQVSSTWKKELDKGLKEHDNPLIVRSLLNVGLAESSIDAANRAKFLVTLASMAKKQSGNPELCALLDMMQAEIYTQFYDGNRWTYDKRQLPLSPLPADYNEWSGEQFRMKINELLKSSLSQPNILSQVKLSQYDGVITQSPYPALYPTLLDFVAYNVIEMAQHTESGLKTNKELRDLAFNTLLEYQPVNSAAHFLAYLQSGRADESAMELYEKNKTEWYSGLALLKADRTDKRKVYFAMKDYVERFPSSPLKDYVANQMNDITQGSIRYDFPEMVAKGGSLKVNLDIDNIKEVSVALYTIIKKPVRYGSINVIDRLICDTVIKTDIDGPFKTKKSVQFIIPEYGCYTVLANPANRKDDNRNNIRQITCSDLMLMSASTPENKGNIFSAFVADLTTGQPIKNVTLTGDTIRKSPGKIATAVTNTDGMALLHTDNYIYASIGADKWARPLRVNNHRINSRSYVVATLTTSLPIYHFGDEVDWFAVAYTKDNSNGDTPLVNADVDVTLVNTGHTDVETIRCTTDQWGRVSGKFKLPENGLAGNFVIKIADHKINNSYGSTSFVVSDYKLPTFTVEINRIDKNTPDKDAVTLSGLAQTYSNFPVAGATVTISTSITTGWRWWESIREELTTIETETDENGNFSVTIPAEILRKYTGNRAVYVTANVTSQGGETRTASTTFVLGKPLYISANIKENIDVYTPVNLNIGFFTPTHDKTERPVTVRFFKHTDNFGSETDEEIAEEEWADSQVPDRQPDYLFTLINPALPIDLSKVESGMYDIVIAPVDTTLADPMTVTNRFVFNKTQTDFPLDKMVWTPHSGTIKMNGQSDELLMGTSRDNLTLLCIVSSKDAIISSRWIKFHKGMNHIEIELPDSVTEGYLTLAGANNGDTYNETYNLVSPGNTRKLEFKIESFRDKVSPLSTENWKFRTKMIIGSDSIPSQSAVMLRLFSKAVNDLNPTDKLGFTRSVKPRSTEFFSVYNGLSYVYFWDDNNRVANTVNPFAIIPEFELYHNSWMGYNRIMVKNLMARATGLFASADSDNGTEDLNVVREYSDEAIVEEKMAAPEAITEMEEEVQPQSEITGSDIIYRPGEIPLALFEPMLVTNPDGTLEYNVTFPDASTTWLLNATAFNKDLYSAHINEEIVAAHPLMIQMSLPRFMRLGDKTTVIATVMNNSGEDLPAIATRFEAIDPSTGNVIAFAEEQVSLDNGQMKVVSLPLYVDKLTPGLLIRARAAGGNYADGEQSMIAVLEASQPVVETTPFFLNPDEKTASVEVEAGKDATVTLEFFQNPTWSVVTALPGLRSGSYSTPIDAAAAICSAAIAEDLLKHNPAIGTAILQWLDSDRADSTLVSMLQRNPDLKIALLEATPWMTDAMNDTQRMQRLSLLFDRKEIKSVYSSAIHKLAKLQRSKGWAWTEYGEESSYWATLSTLEILGYLNQLGCLPTDKQLDTLIRNAVEYIDAEAVKINRNSKGKALPDIHYTLIRTAFKDIRQSSASRRISEVTIQNIIANWKSYNLREKAFAAIILAQNNYHSTAATIVSSISEFAISTPQKGLRWNNAGIGTTARILQAYALTSRPESQINAIRQNLILDKAANNWGSSADATCIIYNILATGPQWTPLNPGTTVVKINADEFYPDKIDNITGYFRADFSNALDQGKADITVTRTGNTPAYGSVYSFSTRPMESISPSGCDELTIEKRFLVKQPTQDGTSWRESTSFQVGDVVKVSLTIKVTAHMQYVVINDKRPACMEPVNQLPAPVWSENICFYRQTGDSSSDIFITTLPSGTYILEQEFTVTHAGQFTSGIATVQSQYAPQYTAHSAGYIINTVK
ncbi:MAG: hypothetical protein K2M07_02765 [Muribaculaceae bacterium]|nr:hypothetical protein [Muribaculaceae bacterium]